MWDFSVGQSISLMARTMPFILLRMAVYFGIAVAYVLVTGVGAGIGWGVGAFGDEGFRTASTFWGAMGGLGLVGGVVFLAREYILYIVKAGHVAVMVELIDGRALPQGKNQITHAATVVKSRFAQASVLFGLDLLIRGVIRSITGLVRGVLSILPLPGVKQITGVLQAFLRMAVGFIDEVILAHAIRTNSTNAFASAREALVLYGQNWKPMLKNAAWVMVIVYSLSFLVFLLMLAPAAAVVYAMPGAWSAGGLIFALIFAWSVKAAVFEPFALACMMQAFFKVTEGQQPNPEWDGRLEQMSKHFRKIKDKALGAANPNPVGEAA